MSAAPPNSSWPPLRRPTNFFNCGARPKLDGRVEPGHDEEGVRTTTRELKR
jgi:hypothetical protein